MTGTRSRFDNRLWALLTVAVLVVVLGFSLPAAAAPCCAITAINAATHVALARDEASGRVFEFTLQNPAQFSSLRVGQKIYANFGARQISLDGRSIAGAIRIPVAPAPAPGQNPAPAASLAPVADRTEPGAGATLPRTQPQLIPGTITHRNPGHAMGLKLPPDDYILQQASHQNQIAEEILKLEKQAIDGFEAGEKAAGRPPLPETLLRAKLPPPTARAFDWTALGKVTPIRDQGACGSCWDFGATAAVESSILIRYNRSADLDLSEQYVLDNAIYGSCSETTGGWTPEAFTEMMLVGTAKESDLPYIAKKEGPRLLQDSPYRVLIWGFVGNGVSPSVRELKEALLRHGPLPVSIEATQSFYDYFDSYPGAYPNQVFNEHAHGRPNHVVLLVGWDDDKGAWRIKNSWGTGDGDHGFGWVAYGSNSIGAGATWAEVWNSRIPLPPVVLQWLEKAKQLARQAEQDARAAEQAAEHALAQAQATADHARAEAEKAAQQAEEKARFAAQQSQVAAQKAREAAAATTQAEKASRQEAAKAAQQAADRANAEASQARKEADRTAKAAQDALDSSAKAIASYIPALPDPRKHLPRFP